MRRPRCFLLSILTGHIRDIAFLGARKSQAMVHIDALVNSQNETFYFFTPGQVLTFAALSMKVGSGPKIPDS